MPRKSIPSTTLVQAVRRYFGLEQQELAAYLGIGRAMVGHLESGRRSLSATLLLRLNPLALHLPATEPPLPLAEALPPGAPLPSAPTTWPTTTCCACRQKPSKPKLPPWPRCWRSVRQASRRAQKYIFYQ